jgi:hypothetical protein
MFPQQKHAPAWESISTTELLYVLLVIILVDYAQEPLIVRALTAILLLSVLSHRTAVHATMDSMILESIHVLPAIIHALLAP